MHSFSYPPYYVIVVIVNSELTIKYIAIRTTPGCKKNIRSLILFSPLILGDNC